MMNEYGYKAEPKPKVNEIVDLTDGWETSSSLSHVYSDEETGPLLKKLIQRAKVRVAEDPSWLDKLRDVRDMLNNTDEGDEIKDILIKALGEETSEDDIEEPADEPEEEEAA